MASKDRVSLSKKADLQFPVSRVMTRCRKAAIVARMSTKTGIALAAVLEYAIQEIIEAGMASLLEVKPARKRLYPTDLARAIIKDKELYELFDGTEILSGHVLPYVTPVSRSFA